MLRFYEWPSAEKLALWKTISQDSAQAVLTLIEELYGREQAGLECLNFIADVTIPGGGGKVLERLEQFEMMMGPVQESKGSG